MHSLNLMWYRLCVVLHYVMWLRLGKDWKLLARPERPVRGLKYNWTTAEVMRD